MCDFRRHTYLIYMNIKGRIQITAMSRCAVKRGIYDVTGEMIPSINQAVKNRDNQHIAFKGIAMGANTDAVERGVTHPFC